MPRPFSREVQRYLDQHLPETHKVFLIRGEVLATSVIDRPPFLSEMSAAPKQPRKDTLVQIEDRDSDMGAYDIRIEFDGHDWAKGDPVSLLGIVPKGQTTVGRPQYIINHASGNLWRAYPDSGKPGSNCSQVQHKKTMAMTLPGNAKNHLYAFGKVAQGWLTSELTPAQDRKKNIAIAAAICAYLLFLRWFFSGGAAAAVQAVILHPWLAIPLVPLVAAWVAANLLALLVVFGLPMGFAWFVFMRLIALIKEPPRFKDQVEFSFAELSGLSNLTDYFGTAYIDGTYVLQMAGEMIHHEMRATEMTDADTRGNHRDELPVELPVEANPAQLALM